jgi:REP element-mobilizing transposase RayT
MRRLRFVPPGSLVEATVRTIHGRLLLRPSPRVCDLVVGIVGRAQRRTGMPIVAFVFLSNHCHFLLRPESAAQMARFMGYVLSNIAREVGRLHGWREKFWSRRYAAIVVSDEEAAQVDRLRYILSHGVKEGFVLTPAAWPGVHCAGVLLDGVPLRGTWYSRTAQFHARRRGEDASERACSTTETVALTPLPCWEARSEVFRRTAIAELIAEVVEAGETIRAGSSPIGAERVVRAHPHQEPPRSARRVAPPVHAATKRARLAFLAAYRAFVDAYRRATARLRASVFDVEFPLGSFPPPRPFVDGCAAA